MLGVTVFGYHAPLESIANPQVTPLDTEAPWYFWWLQGMLKLGDKILMGHCHPDDAGSTCWSRLPYIDRNPYRSLYKRPWAVAIGVLAVLVLVVLSYMGLPEYGIEMEPAQRIIQDMTPQEGEGPLDEVPFGELQAGSYQVNAVQPVNMCPNLDYGCPEFEHFFEIYSDRVNESIEAGKSASRDPGCGRSKTGSKISRKWSCASCGPKKAKQSPTSGWIICTQSVGANRP